MPPILSTLSRREIKKLYKFEYEFQKIYGKNDSKKLFKKLVKLNA